MFFPDRITITRTNDKVLEIGSGGTPHPRSNVLLEFKSRQDKIFSLSVAILHLVQIL